MKYQNSAVFQVRDYYHYINLKYLITCSTSEEKEEATKAKLLHKPTHFKALFYPNVIQQRPDVLSFITLLVRVYLPTAAIAPGGNLASLTHRPRQ